MKTKRNIYGKDLIPYIKKSLGSFAMKNKKILSIIENIYINTISCSDDDIFIVNINGEYKSNKFNFIARELNCDDSIKNDLIELFINGGEFFNLLIVESLFPERNKDLTQEQIISERIKLLMDINNLSENDLADVLELSKMSVRKILRVYSTSCGANFITKPVLIKLCSYFRITPNYLFS